MAIAIPRMTQSDEALRLLAHLYARWFMRIHSESLIDVYEQIRDVLYRASSQQDAYEQLREFAESPSEMDDASRDAYVQAHSLVQQVMQAGGSADALIVGQTDGYRHLCLACSQDEQNFQRIRFFSPRDRRPLLKPEVWGDHRATYSRCQLCLQTINPNNLVLFTFAGTAKHDKPCHCRTCNRAGIAYLLNIYDCEWETQRVLFPALQQVVAPSKQQCVERAIKASWEHGWYMLNKDAVL